MGTIGYQLSMLVNMLLPIKKGTVLFRSFFGQYNDNPKYISEELHRQYPDLNIVWAIRDGKSEEFPSYVKTVELNSKKYSYYCARAQIVVDNYSGCRSSFVTKKSPLKELLVKFRVRKRKNQLNISTWHGTPLKHIAMDEPMYRESYAKPYLNTDILIAGNEVTAKAYKTALCWEKPVMMCGTPRNDILFNFDSDTLKKKLGLPSDKKIVLFAPTYRSDVYMSGIVQIKQMELDRLFSALSERFGGEWAFIFRSHNMVMEAVENSRKAFDARIINGNLNPDMAEYLAVSDVLITDYSSSMFDFMLKKQPCFLLTPDLDNYRNSERGFYFDIESTPFSFSENFEDLIQNICEFDAADYDKKSMEFLDRIGNTEQGTASKSIVKEISDFMGLNKKS